MSNFGATSPSPLPQTIGNINFQTYIVCPKIASKFNGSNYLRTFVMVYNVQIVGMLVREGVYYHQDQICARELVVVVVLCASVSLLALLETLIHVNVMLNSPPAIKFESVLDLSIWEKLEKIFDGENSNPDTKFMWILSL